MSHIFPRLFLLNSIINIILIIIYTYRCILLFTLFSFILIDMISFSSLRRNTPYCCARTPATRSSTCSPRTSSCVICGKKNFSCNYIILTWMRAHFAFALINIIFLVGKLSVFCCLFYFFVYYYTLCQNTQSFNRSVPFVSFR